MLNFTLSRSKSCPMMVATCVLFLFILLSIESLSTERHHSIGVAHAQPQVLLTRQVGGNEMLGNNDERIRRHRLSQPVSFDQGNTDNNNSIERQRRVARQLGKKKKDTKNRHRNKAGKETSKKSQAVSSDVAAPTASARSKTGKKHRSASTSAPSQSEMTPFPTLAEQQTSTKAEKPTSGSKDSKTAKKFAKSIKPQPSPNPTIEPTTRATDSPTDNPTASPSLSPTVTRFFDSFESATFPEYPWLVSNNEEEEDDKYNWALTNQYAFKGSYSIKSPALSSEGPNITLVTLAIPEDVLLPAWFEFALKTTCDDCEDEVDSDDALFVLVDGVYITSYSLLDNNWSVDKIYVEPGATEITFEYEYNYSESENPKSSTAYIDEVYLIPTTSTQEPTGSPTYLPTLAPSVEGTYGDTAAPFPAPPECDSGERKRCCKSVCKLAVNKKWIVGEVEKCLEDFESPSPKNFCKCMECNHKDCKC